METKTGTNSRKRPTLFDSMVIIMPSMLGICNLLWLFFDSVGNERLERFFLYAMLSLVAITFVVEIVFFLYLARDGKKTFQTKMQQELSQEEALWLGGTPENSTSAEGADRQVQGCLPNTPRRDYTALRLCATSVAICYLSSLVTYLVLLMLLSDTKAEAILPWIFVAGAVGILLCTLRFGIQYFCSKDSSFLHLETDYTKFRTWEKYWAHVLVSDRIGVSFALSMSVHVLQYDLPQYLTATQAFYYEQLDMAMFIMVLGAIVWEIFSLRRRHQEVMLSHPKVNNTVQGFYQISLAFGVFVSPVIHIILKLTLPEGVAQITNLIVSSLASLAIIVGVIYFLLYASRYIKADKLTW